VTEEIKLLFDECVGKPVMERLATWLAAAPEKTLLGHILDYQRQGTHDEVWVPQVATEGWVVITADRGRRGKRSKGEKLPILCRSFGITHVMLSSSIHNRSGFEKCQAILAVWPEIVKLPAAPKGSGHLLRVTKTVKGERIELMQLYPSLPPEPQDG
jgi:hypothetical protein